MAFTIDGYLNRIQTDQQQPQRDPTGAHKETLVAVRHQAHHVFTALGEKVAKIRTNTSLSEDGKRQQIAELQKSTDLGVIARPKAANEHTLTQLRSLLYTIPKSEFEPGEARDREREIRDGYKAKPLHERQAAYAAAMKAGKYEYVRAFTQGPLGSLVDAEFQQLVQTEHAQQTQPAAFANYEQAQTLQEHLSSLHDHATKVLLDLPASV